MISSIPNILQCLGSLIGGVSSIYFVTQFGTSIEVAGYGKFNIYIKLKNLK